LIPLGASLSATATTTASRFFDQDGNYLAEWTQFSRPSGISIDAHETIYVADSESESVAKIMTDGSAVSASEA